MAFRDTRVVRKRIFGSPLMAAMGHGSCVYELCSAAVARSIERIRYSSTRLQGCWQDPLEPLSANLYAVGPPQDVCRALSDPVSCRRPNSSSAAFSDTRTPQQLSRWPVGGGPVVSRYPSEGTRKLPVARTAIAKGLPFPIAKTWSSRHSSEARVRRFPRILDKIKMPRIGGREPPGGGIYHASRSILCNCHSWKGPLRLVYAPNRPETP
jgi:hypothetical protein